MIKKIFILAAITFLFYASLTFASEIIMPARQIALKDCQVALYYSQLEQDLNFKVTSVDQIIVPGSAIGYFSKVTNDFKCSGKTERVLLKIITNPTGGFYYWFKAGAGKYELEIPSQTVTNKLSSLDNGYLLGIGLRSQIFPDTIVTPAIAVGLGLNYSLYDLEKFRTENNPGELVDNKLSLTEVQLDLLFSKEFRKFEFFGGAKVLRTYANLTEKQSLSEVSGFKDNIGLFLGSRIKIHSNESLFLEGSFLNEKGFSVGWNVEF